MARVHKELDRILCCRWRREDASYFDTSRTTLPFATISEDPEGKVSFLFLKCKAFNDTDHQEATVRSVAWCIVTKADSGFWPLISFAADAVLYVYNVAKGEFHGVMRGHGGVSSQDKAKGDNRRTDGVQNINALAVHPIDPSILLSASSDHTCRIYDLRETVECPIENPCWPGMAPMALAGPAFGMRVNDGEGFGLGRCIATLTGVISGGHQAPVLGAVSKTPSRSYENSQELGFS